MPLHKEQVQDPMLLRLRIRHHPQVQDEILILQVYNIVHLVYPRHSSIFLALIGIVGIVRPTQRINLHINILNELLKYGHLLVFLLLI